MKTFLFFISSNVLICHDIPVPVRENSNRANYKYNNKKFEASTGTILKKIF
jgi:hypothetical protein